ncbi:hypothetical protein TraAM80_00051 [Trypanosoma rangeli]|uniref:Uncharacterized protein n=1 Tax=Trypanosoma rangeli TaxID=5698 RepID=A0A422P588_TRYRA|nr:uncharacterized protein TraAM80_00051 [Trypanosoma rangeli]RNF12893.1 hypothetical protein TraAM80_00051 [Trypanosoma rangeli]|eukprot:RNF12893.1 hypothetical protein TraAM80_00051 [Trypanosoma rangeli]
MAHVASHCLKMALHLFESRFAMRKEMPLISTAPDEEVDLLWRFVIMCLWVFCTCMRGYETILRGCSPIALETVILLLRVVLVDDEAMTKREELVAWPSGNGYSHRVHSTLGANVRNGALQQKQKERVGSRTAFALELFMWFTLIIFTIDLTNINRASVALFLANTLYWTRLGPKSVVFFTGIYVLVTYFLCPAYSVRDTFLTLSGQGSWVYRVYSSFGLAFSITLFLTETQCLHRVRRAGVWKVLMITRILDKSVANTPLGGLSSLMRSLADYFFFVGFNFSMALCMWFSSMMFEWTSETSFTSIIFAFYTFSAILGEGWGDDFQRVLREAVVCFAMYLVVAALVVFCIPTDSLSFAANGVSSAFFVLYMAAHSPRRVHSSLPLVMVWLGMLAANVYWHVNRSGVNTLHMTWYKELLCVNTITCAGLFMLSTALYVYRWEWPVDPSAAALSVTANGVSKVTFSTRAEHKSKEKNHNTNSSVSITLEKAAATTLATTPSPGKRAYGGGDKATSFVWSPSSSISTSHTAENTTSESLTGTGMNAVEADRGGEVCEEGMTASLVGPVENLLTSISDENAVAASPSCESTHDPQTNFDNSEQEEAEEEDEDDDKEEVSAEEAVDTEMTRDEDDGKYLPRFTASEEVRPTTPPVRKEAEKKVLMSINAFDQQPSSVSFTSQAKRRSDKENDLSSFAVSDSYSKSETLLHFTALPLPLQTSNSSICEERQGGGAEKGKEMSQRVSPTTNEGKKGNKSNDRVTAVAAEKSSLPGNESPSLNVVEKVVPVPLEPPAARNKASATTSAVRRAAPDKVTSTRKENNTKTTLHKETSVVYHQRPSSRTPSSKVLCPEVTGCKGQTVSKVSSRGDAAAAEFKIQNSLPPHDKKMEDRRRASEPSAATRIVSSFTSAARVGSVPYNGHVPEVNTVSGEGGGVAIPQPRSAQTCLKTSSTSSLTVEAVKMLIEEDQTWGMQRSSAWSEKERSVSSLNNKRRSCISSQADDDASLDLGKLHLAPLPDSETEEKSLQRRVSTPTFGAPRSIPQATLHSLENFAKAYIPRVSASGTTDVEQHAEDAKKKGAKNSLNKNCYAPAAPNHALLLDTLASAPVGRSESTFAESSTTVSQLVTPQMFSMNGVGGTRRGAVLYQQAASTIQPHITATPRMESRAMVMPQNPIQQQVPVVLVAMGDGRVTYCPIIPSSYPAAPQIVMQSPHMESTAMPQHLQRGVVYQQVSLSHPQQTYPGVWQQVNQQLHAPK